MFERYAYVLDIYIFFILLGVIYIVDISPLRVLNKPVINDIKRPVLSCRVLHREIVHHD
jgi:hypothetical protein